MKIYSYLALGDSYTIGEQVKLAQSFPYQTVQMLRNRELHVSAPEIIATSGWTTSELKVAIENTQLLPSYNLVSLLIGVNNQYWGKSAEEFRTHFRTLLEMAIKFAEGNSNHVFVLSIPDWGVTPFAADRNCKKIAEEIDLYNFICQAEADYYQTNYIDITSLQRQHGNEEAFLAGDNLHPSGKEYFGWAEQLSDKIMTVLEKSF
ncbi:MAG: GDSL-type esterase/lipase family protein [Ferruginibacter sp.]